MLSTSGYVSGCEIYCPTHEDATFEIAKDMRGLHRSGTRVLFSAKQASNSSSTCYAVVTMKPKIPLQRLPVKFTAMGPAFSVQLCRRSEGLYFNDEFGLVSDPNGILSHSITEEQSEPIFYSWIIKENTGNNKAHFTILAPHTEILKEEFFGYPRRCTVDTVVCVSGSCDGAQILQKLWRTERLYSIISAHDMDVHLEILNLFVDAAAMKTKNSNQSL